VSTTDGLQQVLARISILVANGLADGRLAPEVADPLMSLVQGATAELTTALAGA